MKECTSHRHLEKLTNQEPVAGDMNESNTCGIDEDIIEFLQICCYPQCTEQ
jgi:hypothetical protein